MRFSTAAEARARRALTIVATTAIVGAAALVVAWALAPGIADWLAWPLLALALVAAASAWMVLVLDRPEIPRLALESTALASHIGLSVLLFGFLVAVWAASGAGYFWPAWVGLGLALAAGLHAAVVHGRRARRIEQLEESRAAAVDSRETELRRIERDLHDGAQASLVALGMSIGLAEEKLRTDPEAAQAMLAEARGDAKRALEELRALARGIRPPILSDRGLEAAVAELAARSPVPVAVSSDLPERPPPPAETAAYFVVAEALANAIKHADAHEIRVRLVREDTVLVVEVEDDGRGGADVTGNGLRGLEQRVRALDGALSLESPEGGPTTVRAELRCG
jgi:signal transduction histidine kinase